MLSVIVVSSERMNMLLNNLAYHGLSLYKKQAVGRRGGAHFYRNISVSEWKLHSSTVRFTSSQRICFVAQ